MPDNPSLEGILEPTENDLKLISKLTDSQTEFWFFTHCEDMEHADLSKPTIENNSKLKRKRSKFKEWFYSMGLGVAIATIGITTTHFTFEYIKSKVNHPAVCSQTKAAADGKLKENAENNTSTEVVFFGLDLLAAFLIGLLQADYSLRLANNQYIRLHDDKKRYDIATKIGIKGEIEYEGRNHKAILISEKITAEGGEEHENKIKTLLKLESCMDKCTEVSPYISEFPYILRKRTDSIVNYYLGIVKTDVDGKIELVQLSDEKGMPNEMGKSEIYKHRYDKIRIIAKRLNVIRTNRK